MKKGWQIFIVVAAIGTGVFLSQRPWQVYKEQQNKADGIVSEMQEAERERERLMKEKTKAMSPLGREERIRGKNWTRPGEVVLDEN